jgi:DHA1 family bicyclomycin/chloramphenicol resistance-like MFS transporter
MSSAGRATIRPGTAAFTIVLAMAMALTALGIDTVLPAFPDIRRAMGLDADASEVSALVSFYFLGSSIGLLPAGLLADRYGRRAVTLGGIVLYIAGAIAAVFAPTLGAMLAARVVWGLGSAGPRVAVMAMVRDSYAGAEMAKQMSFILAVFIMVPTFAPAIGSGLLAVGPWQLIFWLCVVLGVVMLAATWRLPETLHPEDRAVLSAGGVYANVRTVFTTPGTLGYLFALSALYGAFIAYLGGSEAILDQVFGLEEWFPLFFGGVSLVLGASMIVNGRVVERVGLDRMIGRVYMLSVPSVTLLFAVSLLTGGTPPFWLFVVSLSIVLFAHQMLIPNVTSAALIPLSHVAGTASAMMGMIPGVVGSIVSLVIDHYFDATIGPLSTAFFVCTLLSVAGFAWARAASRTLVSAV